MKVFLMYPDQDFNLKQSLPPNEASLTQDLELNTIFAAMALGDEFLFEVAKQTILSSLDAPDVISYRQEILKDCLKNPTIVREIYSIPIEVSKSKRQHWIGFSLRHPGGILNRSIAMLQLFIDPLKRLRRIADEHAEKFNSEGFTRFFALIRQELSDDYFTVVENHLKQLRFRSGVLISVQLGKGNEGVNYVLRKPNRLDNHWLKRVFAKKAPVYSFTLPSSDYRGASVLGELKDRGVNLVANALAQSTDHINSFLSMLRVELAFYIGSLNLSEQLIQQGGTITIPKPVPACERRHSFTGLYDAALALTMKQKVVGNDVSADNKDVAVITGANQGGKSTFLRSIGVAQLMMQCGMFVPAELFSANLCRGLFTHFKREEDASMESGKFAEELGRMSTIVDAIRPDALVLFNESFAATNEREGSEIAWQILRALLERRIKVFFVTHLYALARRAYDKKMENAIFLRAARQQDGRRTFKLSEAEPLQTSYGVDVYNKVWETDISNGLSSGSITSEA